MNTLQFDHATVCTDGVYVQADCGQYQQIIATTALCVHSSMCPEPQQAQQCCIVHLETSPVLLYDSGSCLQGLQRV